MGQDVTIADVGMRFGDFYAVRNINVDIGAGEFFSFLGPSGCGKTTLLRMISGFMDPTEGQIRIGGRDMRRIGPNKRPTAMIFQNLALFPLMSVADNIGFGLEVRRISRQERLRRVDALLDLVDLPGAGRKKVGDLSGGQMQRVAIARALAVEPAVLLLDEPLSALDLKLRKHMRAELRNIQRRTDVTFIYITHDQSEALTMSDRVGVMSLGRLEQVDKPDRIYNHPETAFVASFVGETNVLPGRIVQANGRFAVLETELGPVKCRNPKKYGSGIKGVAYIRPETIGLHDGNDSAENVIECRVGSESFEGAFTNIRLKTPQGTTVVMRLNNDGSKAGFNPNGRVRLTFKPENALLLSEEEAGHA